MSLDCPFCTITPDSILLESSLLIAIFDRYPVTPYHTLIITKRHCNDFFSLSPKETDELVSMVRLAREFLCKKDPEIAGFNIGTNCGTVAGQTILHCHTHVIPRRYGDQENPRGGVRGAIPDRQAY